MRYSFVFNVIVPEGHLGNESNFGGSECVSSPEDLIGQSVLLGGDLVEVREVGETRKDGLTFLRGVSLTRYGGAVESPSGQDHEEDVMAPVDGWFDVGRISVVP